MRSLFARSVLLVIPLAGCDAAEIERVDDLLLVSVVEGGLSPVVPEPLLVLETERPARLGCNPRIETDTEAGNGRLSVTVRGLSPGEAQPCPLGAPAYAFVPLPAIGPNGVAVEIRHRGATDRYRVSEGEAGIGLEALVTRTTRPAP